MTVQTRTREQIADEIATRKAQADRLPVHWVEQRAQIMDECDALVDEWLAAES